MSENTEKKDEALSNQEKIEGLKAMFSTLPVEDKAIFTQWCHEEVEKGTVELVGEKLVKMNEQMNSFIARASDTMLKAGAKVYTETNKAFKFASVEEIEDPKEHSSDSAGIWD